jgi:excisionase family DNA binding protein
MSENKINLPELLSITEVSKLLGVSTMTLRRWDTKGILKSFRPTPSSQRRYKRIVVEKFLKSR